MEYIETSEFQDLCEEQIVHQLIDHRIPSLTSNSGKVLAVNSGATGLEWVNPVTIYSGSSAPSAATGVDGDIYIQTD